MSGEVARQLQVLCQALLLGGAMGLAYDLLRIVRVRLRLPLAEGALDLLFWLGATAACSSGPRGPGAGRCGGTGRSSACWAAGRTSGPSAPGCAGWGTWRPAWPP